MSSFVPIYHVLTQSNAEAPTLTLKEQTGPATASPVVKNSVTKEPKRKKKNKK